MVIVLNITKYFIYDNSVRHDTIVKSYSYWFYNFSGRVTVTVN